MFGTFVRRIYPAREKRVATMVSVGDLGFFIAGRVFKVLAGIFRSSTKVTEWTATRAVIYVSDAPDAHARAFLSAPLDLSL